MQFDKYEINYPLSGKNRINYKVHFSLSKDRRKMAKKKGQSDEMRFSMLAFWSIRILDFPGGSVVKNPPANAGDMGSIPGPGRSHKLQRN